MIDSAGVAPGPAVSTARVAPRATRLAFRLLLAVCLASAIASAVLAYRNLSYRREIAGSSQEQLVSLTAKATAALDDLARNTSAVAEAIAADLTAGRLAKPAVVQRIKEETERNAHVHGVCVSYRPYAFDPARRLYSVYYARPAGRLTFVQADEVYDYTRPEHEWFTPVIEHGARWTQPFYDEAGATTMITYATPFFGTNPSTGTRESLGVVSIDISMDQVRRIIESLDLGPSGFGALVSEKGSYLYHPNPELVQGRKTLQDVAREQHDNDRLVLADKVSARESGILDHRSATTGMASWLIYAPVPSTGWSLQNTFILEDLPLDIDRIRRQLIQLAGSLLVALATAAALVAGAHTGRTSRLWTTSALVAAFTVIAIGFVWRVSLTYDAHTGTAGITISDKATLSSVMADYTRASAARHTEPPVYVPTGIFLESAHFSAPNDLSVTGYLWQKYTRGAHDGLTRGFTIAEATDLVVAENYRTTEQGTEVVRWYFNCIVRQDLDRSRYPLEQEKLSLRILHKDLDHNVVLVPDLAAYTFHNPSLRPGLASGLVFPGWHVTHSFFELRRQGYETNFGIDRSLGKELFPSLHFNIVIKRDFVDAFISNLTALVIVAILLFTLLLLSVGNEKLVSYMQAGSGRVLNICAGMFFVIAFSHIEIRRRIAAEEVFYLEYFYLLIYVAILAISINSVLFAMGAPLRIVRYRDNLIPKLLFWPALLLAVFAVSVYTFY
jgi:hypothetical protein